MHVPLPVFQHFDCQSCGYCCHELVVNVRPAEREAIIAAGWADRIADQPLFETYRYRGKRYHRLAHKPGGGCVFLNEEGLCSIHAEQGFQAKPLACRSYPYAPIPGADAVRLDLRADCPSVAANRGRPLAVHQAEIDALANELDRHPLGRLPVWPTQRDLNTREFLAVVNAFDGLLADESLPVRVRLRACCHLLDFMYELSIRKVRDERFLDLLEMLVQSAVEDAQSEDAPAAPGRKSQKLFRQWLFLHGIADEGEALKLNVFQKYWRSWKRYGQARQFVRHAGMVPKLGPDWPEASFEQVLAVASPPDDDSLEPMLRILRVKLQAHSFAGPAYYRYKLLTGLTAWLLSSCLVGWFARLNAVSQQRKTLTRDDIQAGVRRTHCTFGASPVFSRISERTRLRGLAQRGVPRTLIDAYAP
jgi:lysine-N-methylase